MHKLTSIALLFIILISRTSSFAQCHHTGSHVHHSSSHSHVHFSSHGHSHYHYHSHERHSSYNRGYSSGSALGYGARLSDPLRGTHEIAAGAGAESAWQLLDKNVVSATPNYFGSYRYFITNGVAIGFSAGTQTTSGTDTCNCLVPGTQPGKGPLYDFKTTTVTVAAELTWVLFSKNSFQAYEGVAAGVSYYNERDSYADKTTSLLSGYKFNGQLTLAGIRFGRALGGFVELGFGYKGLINGGISYQAGYKKAHRFG